MTGRRWTLLLGTAMPLVLAGATDSAPAPRIEVYSPELARQRADLAGRLEALQLAPGLGETIMAPEPVQWLSFPNARPIYPGPMVVPRLPTVPNQFPNFPNFPQ